MAEYALAVIERRPLKLENFNWMNDREHKLFRGSMADIVKQWHEYIGETDDIPDATGWSVTRLKQHVAATNNDHCFAVVDPTKPPDKKWPTTGMDTSVTTNIWLIVADYLSYCRWCEILGINEPYKLAKKDVQRCKDAYGSHDFGRACSLLPEGNPVRKMIEDEIPENQAEALNESGLKQTSDT